MGGFIFYCFRTFIFEDLNLCPVDFDMIEMFDLGIQTEVIEQGVDLNEYSKDFYSKKNRAAH